MDLVNIGIKSIFTENIILAYFLGMCSFISSGRGSLFLSSPMASRVSAMTVSPLRTYSAGSCRPKV